VLGEESSSLAAHQAEQKGSNKDDVEADADVRQKLKLAWQRFTKYRQSELRI